MSGPDRQLARRKYEQLAPAYDRLEGIGAEGRLIGIDLSPDMLAKARERMERHGWENVTLVESAVEDASIPATVDACISVLTLRVEPRFLDGAYVAWGTVADSDPSLKLA